MRKEINIALERTIRMRLLSTERDDKNNYLKKKKKTGRGNEIMHACMYCFGPSLISLAKIYMMQSEVRDMERILCLFCTFRDVMVPAVLSIEASSYPVYSPCQHHLV